MQTYVKKQEVSVTEAVLHEQKALERLKRILFRQLVNAIRNAARPELVREVAPGQPPLARHEWERLEQRPIL